MVFVFVLDGRPPRIWRSEPASTPIAFQLSVCFLFYNLSACAQTSSNKMYGCATCTREFGSVHAAAQHMNAVNHCAECETCDEQFYNQRACNQHMNDCDHWAPRYDCEACNLQFGSFNAARRHMDNNNHWRQHYCRECQRGFQNENNLQQV